MITVTFPDDERGAAIGSWTAWTGIAMVVGPLGGGALIDSASWRWIFAINVPLLCALGLAGPVFALIEQPIYGWSDPLVLVPGVAGVLVLVAFLAHEHRSDHPMLPLEIFRSRNTLVMFALSRRFGALSARIGPRLLMGAGPIVAGLGLVWMGRLGSEVDYVSDMLPGVLLFSLGLAMTVAPLTSTVLGAVPQHHAGVASGANNAIARVASLLAIAAVGAVVAAQFSAGLDDRLANVSLTPAERTEMVGLISLVGIANPPRTVGAPVRCGRGGPSQLQHPCPEARRAEPAVTA